MVDDPPPESGGQPAQSGDTSAGVGDTAAQADDTPTMAEQELVAAFVETHDLAAPPAYRLLDLVSEVGEVAREAATSTGYGASPSDLAVAEDELGDALFALLALAEGLDVDAGAALRAAVEKYERRLDDGDDPGSGG